MRVLIINTLYPPSKVGGAERSVALLAEALASHMNSVHVACLYEGDETVTTRQGLVTVHRLPLRNRYWPYQQRQHPRISRALWHVKDAFNRDATADLTELIERIAPDVIHTNNLTGFSTEIWPWARKRGLKVVHTLRDYSLLCSRSTLFRHKTECANRCLDCRALAIRKKVNSRHVDLAVSISKYVAEKHREFRYFTGVPSRIIYNTAQPGNSVPDTVNERRRQADRTVRFGFLGRVEPEKGISVALKALQRSERPNWSLLVAGEGRPKYVASLRSRFPDDRINWAGFMEARLFYEQIDILLVPALWPEPLSRTIIESLWLGIPIIYSDAGGQPEIGNLARQSVLYPRSDVAFLSARLDEVMADPGTWKHRRKASAQVLDRFSAEHVASAYLSVYREVSGQEPGPPTPSIERAPESAVSRT